jgi:hypothetical protein
MKKDSKNHADSIDITPVTLEINKQQSRISTEEYSRYIHLMDISRRINNIRTRVYNTTFGVFNGKMYPYASVSELPLNPSKLVDDLLYIHGHQILVDGFFNADCHPGALLFFFHFLICNKTCVKTKNILNNLCYVCNGREFSFVPKEGWITTIGID